MLRPSISGETAPNWRAGPDRLHWSAPAARRISRYDARWPEGDRSGRPSRHSQL